MKKSVSLWILIVFCVVLVGVGLAIAEYKGVSLLSLLKKIFLYWP